MLQLVRTRTLRVDCVMVLSASSTSTAIGDKESWLNWWLMWLKLQSPLSSNCVVSELVQVTQQLT